METYHAGEQVVGGLPDTMTRLVPKCRSCSRIPIALHSRQGSHALEPLLVNTLVEGGEAHAPMRCDSRLPYTEHYERYPHRCRAATPAHCHCPA